MGNAPFDFGLALSAVLAVGAMWCLTGVDWRWRLPLLLGYGGAFAGAVWASRQPWSSAVGTLVIGAVAIGFIFFAARRPLRPPLLLLVCGLLVAYFSGNQGSAVPMNSFLTGFAWLSPEMVEAIVIGFRKTVHLSFYAALAVTGLLSAKDRTPWPLAAALAWALAHAVFDETRQMHVLGRNGSWWDVLLDGVGMATGLAMAAWFRRREHRRRQPGS
ncbi:MAG: VanZ family protein [Fimbriimonadaceae bacterium]|nr:VanZ family protein [Fimbriimonadaceae bacterium]